jgi:hypothetical protein
MSAAPTMSREGKMARSRVRPVACVTASVFLSMGVAMTSANAAFVYVGSSDSQDVTVLALKSNGELTPIETKAVPGPSKPGG